MDSRDGASWSLRRARAEDADHLLDMLVAAADWAGHGVTREVVESSPEVAHYVAGWPRPGDLGVVAVAADPADRDADGAGSVRVGAAWLRRFPADDPGYGFVAADVPELSVGVVARWRGRGVGRSLLRRLVSEAAAAGVPAISLSVERANRARHLYLAEGFEVVARHEAADTMLLRPLRSP